MTGKRARRTGQTTANASARRDPRVIVRDDLNVGEPLLYTTRQAATKLNVSVPTVERLIAHEALWSVKVGRRRLIPAWATIAYLRAICEAQGVPDEYGLMAG